jgi:anhydro-N-acetylmuramic acid kinase
LVPAFHHAVFHSTSEHRAVVNIGGIANITDLPLAGDVRGFDCGPGNVLLDEWILESRGLAYDDDGAWAASGKVIPVLLDALLDHEFFKLAPPKSTGRDTFNFAWVKRTLAGGEAQADVQATLLELTAVSIARSMKTHCAGASEAYVCGGGAHNRALLARLAALLPDKQVGLTNQLGVAADWVEALAFAWLARQTLTSQPGNLPVVTGAKGLRVLGAIYPA